MADKELVAIYYAAFVVEQFFLQDLSNMQFLEKVSSSVHLTTFLKSLVLCYYLPIS